MTPRDVLAKVRADADRRLWEMGVRPGDRFTVRGAEDIEFDTERLADLDAEVEALERQPNGEPALLEARRQERDRLRDQLRQEQDDGEKLHLLLLPNILSVIARWVRTSQALPEPPAQPPGPRHLALTQEWPARCVWNVKVAGRTEQFRPYTSSHSEALRQADCADSLAINGLWLGRDRRGTVHLFWTGERWVSRWPNFKGIRCVWAVEVPEDWRPPDPEPVTPSTVLKTRHRAGGDAPRGPD